MALKEDIKPITYLKNHTAELVAEIEEKGRPVVITQNGTAKVVVLDVASYDRWRRATALLRLLAHSEAAVREGKTLSQEEVFARAERALEAASRGD